MMPFGSHSLTNEVRPVFAVIVTFCNHISAMRDEKPLQSVCRPKTGVVARAKYCAYKKRPLLIAIAM